MEELQRGLPGAAGEAAREALREAERNMGEARDGLRGGDTPGALDRQAEAIDNMREGMRQMGDDLRRAENTRGGDQGQTGSEATAENGRDPLGRPLGSRGGIGSNENMLPEADSAARARALLDEIPPPLGRAGAAAARARLPAPPARPVLRASGSARPMRTCATRSSCQFDHAYAASPDPVGARGRCQTPST